jgi:outer membrane receptor for ferrienterochelin and colicins
VRAHTRRQRTWHVAFRDGWDARAFLLSLILLLAPSLVAGQGLGVRGTVRDSATQAPVPHARIAIAGPAGDVVATALTDLAGAFELRGLAPGGFDLSVSAIGFRQVRVALTVAAGGERTPLVIDLVAYRAQLQGIVVTASRQAQSALDAPATTHLVTKEDMATTAAPTVAEHLRSAPGFDVAGGGVMQSNVVARGFNGLFSGELLTLVDHRFAYVPSLRVNVLSLLAPAVDDIEQIEVVLGPGAALYGPNAASGVMHLTTRSPLTSQGTQLALEGGERGFFRGSGRTAWMATPSLGVKVSGEYARVNDWQERDSVEEALITARGGAPRDYDVSRYSLEARADWAVTPDARLTATIGRAELVNALEPTGESGVAQVKGWSLTSYQLRGESGRLSANVFLNQSDAGNTTPLRSGMPLVDQSSLLAASIQHGFGVGSSGSLRYGADLIRTNPVTGGTINGRNESRDRITEGGLYAHGDAPLTDQLNLTLAARADWHSEFTEAVISPRVALVWKPSSLHALRVAFNKAYTTPANYQFFVDEFLQPLNPALPYGLRLLGVPDGGFQFRHDCTGGAGGLCMRSPFDPSGGFRPAAAAPFWQAVVEALAPSLPPGAAPLLPLLRSLSPTNDQVATQLAILNLGAGAFDPIAADAVRDFEPLRPTLSHVFEVGYKGLVADRMSLSADIWTQRRRDFVFLAPVTPNVFFDAASLGAYLTSAFTQAGVPGAAQVAAQLAGGFASVPIGTVQPDHELVGPTDIALSYRNAGSVDLWGLDLAAESDLSAWLGIAATYSHLSKNLFAPDEIDGLNEVPLNAPRHKATVSLNGRAPRRGVTSNLRVRWVNGFPVHAGVFRRDVPSYAVLDAGVAWQPAPLRGVTWSVTASNLLDNRHYEFAGTPRLGRLVMTRVGYGF